MKHKTVQDLVNKAVALEKRVTQVEIAEILLSITENNCITDEDARGAVRGLAESLKKGEILDEVI